MNIPNLPVGQWVDEKGYPTDEVLTFLQNLISELKLKAGQEGLVVPSQTTANKALIQANMSGGPVSAQTLEVGTLLYELFNAADPPTATQNKVYVAVLNNPPGDMSVVFKQIVTL